MNAAPRRVLLMSGSLEGGGSERQILQLARLLDRRRFAPQLYLTHRRGGLLNEVPGDCPVFAFDDAPAVATAAGGGRWHLPGQVFRQQQAQFRRLVLEQRIEVIYDRTFQMTRLAACVDAFGVPRVSTVVSLPDQMVPQLETRWRAWKVRQLRRAYRRSAAVIAVSDAAARVAERYYRLPAGQVQTIRNPIDVDRVQAAAKMPCQVAWPRQDGAARLICIGRLSREKDPATLVEALAQLQRRDEVPGWQCLIVGDGPLRSELASRVEAAGLSDRVRLTGSLANPLPLLAAADMLVLPSRIEGLPNVVLEALSVGCPVIATTAGGTPELLQQGRWGGLVPPAQPDRLAAAIEQQIARRPQPAARAAAQAYVRQEFATTKLIPMIEHVLLSTSSAAT